MTRAKCDQIHPIVLSAIFFPRPPPRFDEVHKVAWLVVVLLCEIQVVHLFTVFVHAPVLTIEVDDAALVGPLIEVQLRQMAQGVNVRVPNVGPRFKGIIVIGCSLENQALIGIAILDVKEFGFERVVVAHLVAGDVVKSSLPVSIAVISMLVAVPRRLHPKCAVSVKELNVRTFISKPLSVPDVISAHRDDGNGVRIRTKEIRVGGNETRRLAWRHIVIGVNRHSPHHGGLCDVDGASVQGARFRGGRAVKCVVEVISARHSQVD